MLVGRQTERTAAREQLDRHGAVQLLGPAGIGKSALALTLVGEGSVVVSLEGVDADGVVERIARVLDVPADPPAVAGALTDVELLVLDSAEGTADRLADTLAPLGPRRVVVTSRIRTDLGGVVEIGPLAPPDAHALFATRVHAVGASEVLRDEADAVAELVRSLEGWPLALELAASRLRVFGAEELLRSGPLAVLEDRSRPGRHGSLARAIQSSWDELDDADRTALAAVALFVGPFDRRAFLEVGRASLDTLERLLDASLIRWAAVGGGRRYRLLTPIRDFARLHADDSARQRYAEWILEAADRAVEQEPSEHALHARRTLSELAADLHTLRQGATAARAALALGVLARAKGPVQEAMHWLDSVERDGLEPAIARRLDILQAELAVSSFQGRAAITCTERWPDSATTLRWRGLASLRIPDIPGAIALLERAIRAADREGDAYERAATRFAHGVALLQHGEHARAAEGLTDAHALLADVDAPDLEGLVLKFLANVQRELGIPPEQRLAYIERAVDLHASTGHSRLEAMSLNILSVCRVDGRHPEAEATLQRAKAVARRAGVLSTGRAMRLLEVLLAIEAGCLDIAAHGLSSIQADGVEPFFVAWCEALMAVVSALEGRTEIAAMQAKRALQKVRELGLKGDARLFASLGALLGVAEPPAPDPSIPSTAPAAVLAALARRVWDGAGVRPQDLASVDAFVEPRVFAKLATLGQATEVASDGSWFQVGADRVDLGRRRVLKRVLAALATHANEPLTQSELLALGWPGERPTPASGRARVHVAIADLRKLGLRDALHTAERDGEVAYRLEAVCRDA